MKPLYHLALSIFLLGAASINARAQEEAPLGLLWGISSADVLARGVELTEMEGSQFGKSFSANKLDKVVSDQKVTFLSFGYNDKLWQIAILSREFTNDPYGSTLRGRYDDLANLLSEKYGKPVVSHHLGSSIYAEPKYFMAGIRNGESKWSSFFDLPSLSIVLFISADDSSTGHWKLVYRHKPLNKDFEASKRSREKGSL